MNKKKSVNDTIHKYLKYKLSFHDLSGHLLIKGPYCWFLTLFYHLSHPVGWLCGLGTAIRSESICIFKIMCVILIWRIEHQICFFFPPVIASNIPTSFRVNSELTFNTCCQSYNTEYMITPPSPSPQNNKVSSVNPAFTLCSDPLMLSLCRT